MKTLTINQIYKLVMKEMKFKPGSCVVFVPKPGWDGALETMINLGIISSRSFNRANDSEMLFFTFKSLKSALSVFKRLDYRGVYSEIYKVGDRGIKLYCQGTEDYLPLKDR